MSISIEQKYTNHSKTINSNGEVVSYKVNFMVFGVEASVDDGYEDEALLSVLTYLKENPPSNINAAELDTVEIVSRIDQTTFEVSATYSKPDTPSPEDDEEPTLSFSCGGGTRHVIEAIEQELVAGQHPKLRPGKLIGYNGKSLGEIDVSGTDIPAPNFRETYTKGMSVSKLTTTYRRKVGKLVGSVNSTKFKGWEPGEVLFEGASFSTPNDGSNKVIVSFDFLIRPNEDDIEYGGTKISKKGFEYIWSIPRVFQQNGVLHAGPKAVYRAKVCKSADFSQLGL